MYSDIVLESTEQMEIEVQQSPGRTQLFNSRYETLPRAILENLPR